MKTLDDRERSVLDYIVKTIRTNGYSPSVRDIQRALGFGSTSTVHMYLERLEAEGYIHKEDGKSRTLRVDEYEYGGQTKGVPVLGTVHAGLPVLAEENFDGTLPFDSTGLPCLREDLFALRVIGDSMIGVGIYDGDYVIVEKKELAENGEIVVALVEDAATVKTFYKERGAYRLQPENPAMEAITVPEVRILGHVVASLRYYHS